MVIAKAIGECANRVLSSRESARIGAVAAYAMNALNNEVSNGTKVRVDDFIDSDETGRSKADEVFEGILLSVKGDHEEKKLKYMGYLFSLIMCDAEVTISQSNLLIKAASDLTYNQLRILALVRMKDSYNLKNDNYRHTVNNLNAQQIFLLQEIHELEQKSFINCVDTLAFGLTDIIPNKIITQGVGNALYRHMKLNKISCQELEEIANLLR